MNIEKINMYLEIIFGRTVLVPFYRRKVKGLKLETGDIVLDFGCGTGNASRFIANGTRELVCLDTDDDKLKMAGKALKKYKNVVYISKNIINWLYDKQFTKVNVIYVLHDLSGKELNDTAERIHFMSADGCLVHITEPKKENHGIEPGLLINTFESAGFRKIGEKQKKNSFFLVFKK